jgi:hypothetical protein
MIESQSYTDIGQLMPVILMSVVESRKILVKDKVSMRTYEVGASLASFKVGI